MSRLIVVMPMAGDGQRFKDAGYTTPKPLIEVDGKPLFIHAIESLSFRNIKDIHFIFVCRSEHDKDGVMTKRITEEMNLRLYGGKFTITYLDHKTRGSLETIMTALDSYKENLKEKTNILSIDCDFGFKCERYIKNIEYEVNDTLDSSPSLMTFYAKDPKYSFVKLKSDGMVAFTAEKKPISSYAIAGCYFLGEYGDLSRLYEEYVKDYENGNTDLKELYVSGIYNYFIKYDFPVTYVDMNFHTDMLWSFNVPADLENYDKNKSIWDR